MSISWQIAVLRTCRRAVFGGSGMSLSVFGRIVGFFGEAGGLFCDISALGLLFAPLAAFAVWFVLLLVCGNLRKKSRVWYVVAGDVCLFLLLALYLCRGDLQDAAPVLALFLCAKAVYLLLYGALCLIPAQKRERKAKQKKPRAPVAETEEDTLSGPLPAAPARPQKVRCFSDDAHVTVEKDVRLEHIFSVLERLREMPLGAGDRLEAQKMEDILRVYRAKTELSATEACALNDILAALLKMMAKYDL